jgi:hypothetical protein
MLEEINWQPLMELLYPFPLYQVPDAAGKPVPFDELLREQRKRMATNPQEHHGLNCILMDPAWKAPKEEPTPKEKKCL